MLYLDTSVIVAYYCPEPLSEKAEAFVRSKESVSVSRLAELEMFSVVSRKIREKNLTKGDGTRIFATFISHLNSSLYTIVSISDDHYRLARDWIGLLNNNLRSLDALHLAVASSEGMIVVTADLRLARSAETLGVSSILLE